MALKYESYGIVMKEMPEHITLAFSLTGCKNNCKGCHSPHLREDIGEILDESKMISFLDRYDGLINGVCFLGDNEEVIALSKTIKEHYDMHICVYSGNERVDSRLLDVVDYIKVGGYVEKLGGLTSPTTNQRYYSVVNGKIKSDLTHKFRLK